MRDSVENLIARGKSIYDIEKELGLTPEKTVRAVMSVKNMPRKISRVDILIYLHEKGFEREDIIKIMGITPDQYHAYRMGAKKRNYVFKKKKTRREQLIECLRNGINTIDGLMKAMNIPKYALFQIISRARKDGLIRTEGKGKSYRIFLIEQKPVKHKPVEVGAYG